MNNKYFIDCINIILKLLKLNVLEKGINIDNCILKLNYFILNV